VAAGKLGLAPHLNVIIKPITARPKFHDSRRARNLHDSHKCLELWKTVKTCRE
jgi:hypothetical protein